MNHQLLLNLLSQLQEELKKSELWTVQKPTLKQLSSTEPFCVDMMPFEQWLQWIFIPKLNQLIAANNLHFSHVSDIASMAEYVFEPYQQVTGGIVDLLKQIDAVINS